jgi:hypothetical protein
MFTPAALSFPITSGELVLGPMVAMIEVFLANFQSKLTCGGTLNRSSRTSQEMSEYDG